MNVRTPFVAMPARLRVARYGHALSWLNAIKAWKAGQEEAT
ncbi:MAG: hypothetical protein AB1813_22390 [Verrucomicrobiota bacterium]